MFNLFLAVSLSLLIGGRVFSHTSLIGEGSAKIHPSIQSFIASLSPEVRMPFTGRCAEAALMSDQLWALDSARSDGQTANLGEAAPHFKDSAIISKMIRGHGDPEHGKTSEPCAARTLLLERLGVRVIL